MKRDEALASVRANVENRNLVNHMLATEAIMRALARRFGENEDEWGLAGLLHDIDVELTQEDPDNHGKLGADLAGELGASNRICHAIMCHNVIHGVECENALDRGLRCADPLTGLITACVLVRPDRKLESLSEASVMKRYKEKRFAAGADREQIAGCAEIGLTLGEFVALGVESMKEIAPELGM